MSETRQETAQREGTTQTLDAKGKILEYAWWLKKNGKSDSTIEGRTKLLRILVKRGANLSTSPQRDRSKMRRNLAAEMGRHRFRIQHNQHRTREKQQPTRRTPKQNTNPNAQSTAQNLQRTRLFLRKHARRPPRKTILPPTQT